MDYSQLSDDELRAIIDGTDPVLGQAIKASKERQSQPLPPPSKTEGMSNTDLFLAGMGKAVGGDWEAGIKEAPKVLFGNSSDLSQVNAERSLRSKADSELLDTWPGKLGNFAGKAALFAAAPARIPAQVAMSAIDAGLSGGQGNVEGVPGFLADRAIRAGADGTVARLAGIPISGAGKVSGAVKGEFRVPEGAEAMRLDEAARRLGVNRNLGSLDQSGRVNAFETSAPNYAKVVEEQERKLKGAGTDVVQIPSSTGKSYTERTLEGEKFRRGLVEAGDQLLAQGSQGWKNLDDYVTTHGLPGVGVKDTQSQLSAIASQYTPLVRNKPNLDKNPVIARVAEFDDESANMIKSLLNGQGSVQLPFSEVHQLQSAVGKALGRAEKDASAPGASMTDRKVRTELKKLYSTISSDVNAWTSKDAQAQGMYENAKAFWRDSVVPGALNNKLYTKANRGVYGMHPRGYSEPSQVYSDIVNNPMKVSDLYPYMSPGMRDLTDTLRTMPDVSASMVRGQPHPSASGLGMRQQMAGLAVGSPLYAVKHFLSHTPLMEPITQSVAGKRLYFAKDMTRDTPIGRSAWGLSQFPQMQLTGGLNQLRLGDPGASPKE